MKNVCITLLIGLLASGTSDAQNSPLNQSVVGHNASDAFTYNGNTVSHYSIGWYNDVTNTAPMAYISGYNGFKFFTGAQPRITIDVEGRIGIGTISPLRNFQLGNSNSNYGSYGRLAGNFGAVENQNHARWEFNDQNFGIGAGKISSNGNTDDDLYLWSYKGEGRDIRFMSTLDGNADMTTWSSNMIIKGESGNVGIGTLSPDTKLAVKGIIHAQGVKVDINGWADYVFHRAYRLPSLTSVESYLDKNHRLPDMPSEQEVKTNGVELGEMVKLQTKKIEELTLYLIQQQKEIKALKMRFQRSNKK